MGNHQIIQTDGSDMVLLSRNDYEALLARAGDDAAEDQSMARLIDATDDAIARGHDVALPESVWEAIEQGGNPCRVVREFRGLAQYEVARHVPISQTTLSRIERGTRDGSIETIKAIARILRIPVDVLLDQPE